MVKDHQIDWNRVIEILNLSQLCVAHNAAFDRAFLDKNLAESKNKVWACSINDIDWIERGFTNSKLELLLIITIIFIKFRKAVNGTSIFKVFFLLCY